ncbi:hypothetical protein AVEN_70207-1 [Araneus ventricosus]|uniref:Uncharacterized protein n=1 Tax=Araneus ventricosus TaxID=182803 RepID=A0A4Y2FFF0_ARAVE|nr:hypothetical protein AVEN_70207-1 [Araneus ventricosus]
MAQHSDVSTPCLPLKRSSIPPFPSFATPLFGERKSGFAQKPSPVDRRCAEKTRIGTRLHAHTGIRIAAVSGARAKQTKDRVQSRPSDRKNERKRAISVSIPSPRAQVVQIIGNRQISKLVLICRSKGGKKCAFCVKKKTDSECKTCRSAAVITYSNILKLS